MQTHKAIPGPGTEPELAAKITKVKNKLKKSSLKVT